MIISSLIYVPSVTFIVKLHKICNSSAFHVQRTSAKWTWKYRFKVTFVLHSLITITVLAITLGQGISSIYEKNKKKLQCWLSTKGLLKRKIQDLFFKKKEKPQGCSKICKVPFFLITSTIQKKAQWESDHSRFQFEKTMQNLRRWSNICTLLNFSPSNQTRCRKAQG